MIIHSLSGLMMGSNHADAYCHLKHHRHNMSDEDHEGHCATKTFWQVLIYGPKFPFDLNRATWTEGGSKWQQRLLIDWALITAVIAISFMLNFQGLYLHLVAMAIGQCFTALLAVWITHQGTQQTGLAGRSQRGALAWLAYQMFYHREHHLFPNVPVSRLPELAKRLDDQVEGYKEASKPVIEF